MTAVAVNAWTAVLSWNPQFPYTSVQVSRGGTVLDTLSGVHQFTDHLLWPSTSYQYTLRWLGSTGAMLASSVVDVTTPATTSLVTPFFPNSAVFSKPLGANVSVAANSAAMIGHSVLPYTQTSDLTDSDAWGIPVSYANQGTQAFTPKCLLYWCNVLPGSQRIPSDAAPSTGSDGHLAVLDGAGDEFDMWQAQFSTQSDDWNASTMFGFEQSGSGVACPPSDGCSMATATGFALTAGIVRPEEIAQGQIDHALVITLPAPEEGIAACPAVHTDGTDPSSLAIPEGSLLQLNPDLDLSTLGLPAWETVIARTMQVYGAYVGDRGGSLAIRAQSDIGRGYDAWADAGVPENGANGAYLYNLPWSQMRVLTPPSTC